MVAYTVVLTVLVGVMVTLIATRADVGATILRTPGMLYQENGENISNLYNYKIINKTSKDMPLEFRLVDGQGQLRMVGEVPHAAPAGVAEGALFIDLPRGSLTEKRTDVKVGIYSGDKLVRTVKTGFVGPATTKAKAND
jgi:polyferredoxin